MSHSISRRRRWRTCATTLALTLGSLAVPAAALADGQLDPAFNGTGYHLGSAGEGTVFTNSDNRIPMVVQADGRDRRRRLRAAASMTLMRYNVNGTIDATFGNGGIATASIGGTPSQTSGNSGATAMTLDTAGNIIVAGYGGSQSMVVVRFTAAGQYNASAVCYAPHLIDYSARAVAVRPNGSIVLVGYARDRHPAFAVPAGPNVTYGQRAVADPPRLGQQHHGLRRLPGGQQPLARLDRRDDRRSHAQRHRARCRARRPLLRRRRRRCRTTATSSPRRTAPTPTSPRATARGCSASRRSAAPPTPRSTRRAPA